MTKLKEQINRFKKLALVEVTSASSSGSYEQPLSFEVEEKVDDYIGITITDDAPQVDVVDITQTTQDPTNDDDKNINIEELEFDLEDSDIDVDVDINLSPDEDSEEILTLMNTLGLEL